MANSVLGLVLVLLFTPAIYGRTLTSKKTAPTAAEKSTACDDACTAGSNCSQATCDALTPSSSNYNFSCKFDGSKCNFNADLPGTCSGITGGANCETCDVDPTKCKTCKTGYYGNGTTECAVCAKSDVTNCATVTCAAADASTCATCESVAPHLSTDSKTCSACVKDCKTCVTSSTTECAECDTNYAISADKKSCTAYTCTCPYGTAATGAACTSNAAICSACSTGYTLNTTTKACDSGSYSITITSSWFMATLLLFSSLFAR